MISGRRRIKDGRQFDSYFSKAKGEFVTVENNAKLTDTVALMKEVITNTKLDTKQIAKLLKADTPIQTCSRIWNFCFEHIQYKKDEEGTEQVRFPVRTWQDRHTGVDCDCFTVFICSILSNLQIPFLIRITGYKGTEFEHVYPVALIGNKEIILDCVLYKFNVEVPYKIKKDISMNLQFLNGLDDDEYYPSDTQNDYLNLHGVEQRKARRQQRQERKKAQADTYQKNGGGSKLLHKLGKGIQSINKINPVTASIRAGILAAMKTNLFNIAGKLRYTYWNDQQALSNNVDMAKFAKYKKVRERLEGFFTKAGGNVANLKKAILTGRANRDKKVSLNGFTPVVPPITNHHDLIDVVGEDIYYDEFSAVQNKAGLNGAGLGSVIASVATVTTFLTVLAGIIKSIGGMFKKGTAEQQKETIEENTAMEEQKTNPLLKLPPNLPTLPDYSVPLPPTAPVRPPVQRPLVLMPTSSPYDVPNDPTMDESTDEPMDEPTQSSIVKSTESTLPATVTKSPSVVAPAPDTKSKADTGIVKWVKANKLATGLIAVGLIAGVVMLAKSKQQTHSVNGLEGVPKPKRKVKASPVKKKITKAKPKPKRRTGSVGKRYKPIKF